MRILVFFFLTILLILLDRKFNYYFLIFLIPFYAIFSLEFGSSSLSIVEIALFFLFYKILLVSLYKAKLLVFKKKIHIYIFLLIIATLMSFIINSGQFKWVVRFVEYGMFFYSSYYMLNNYNDIYKAVKALLFSSGFVFLFGVIQFLMPRNTVLNFYWLNVKASFGDKVRVFSFFDITTYLAVFSIFIVSITFSFLLSKHTFKKSTKVFFLFLFLFGILNVFLTFSRTGFISLIVVMLYLIISLIKNKITYIASFLVFISSSYFWLRGLWLRFQSTFIESSFNVLHRFHVWLIAIKGFLGNKIMGIGPGNFRNYYLTYKKAYMSARTPVVENIFLYYLVHYGIIGFLIFMIILFSTYKALNKNIDSNSSFKIYLNYGIKAGFLGFLVAGMTASLTNLALNMVFWFLISLVFKMHYLEKRELI